MDLDSDINDENLQPKSKRGTKKAYPLTPASTKRPQRARKKLKWLDGFAFHAYLTCLETVVVTTMSYDSAISCLDKDNWKIAMDKEYFAIMSNNNWDCASYLQIAQKLVADGYIKSIYKAVL